MAAPAKAYPASAAHGLAILLTVHMATLSPLLNPEVSCTSSSPAKMVRAVFRSLPLATQFPTGAAATPIPPRTAINLALLAAPPAMAEKKSPVFQLVLGMIAYPTPPTPAPMGTDQATALPSFKASAAKVVLAIFPASNALPVILAMRPTWMASSAVLINCAPLTATCTPLP